MKRRGLWIVAGLLAVALAAVFLLIHSQAPPAEQSASGVNSPTVTAGTPDAAVPSSTTASAESAATQSASQGVAPDVSAPEVAATARQDAKGTMFRTDSAGRLITDERARLNIEELVALNDPQELRRKVQELAQTLPPAAGQQLPELVDHYRNYSAAQRQAIPPDQAPTSEQDAITQLETLHALRVQHFGKEVSEGFFGSEEKMQRELIELMRVQNDPSLTLQEKAEKAQALSQSMAELKARQ